MSTANGLSVFPPPRIPRISVPNPHFRKPSLKTVKTVKPTDSVVIALEEIQSPNIAEEHTQDERAQSQASTTQRSTSSASNPTQGSPDPSTISSTATLVQPLQDERRVAIKSMFPVYNPSVSLDRQSYYPPRSIPAYDPRQMAIASTQAKTLNYPATAVEMNQANMADATNSHEPIFSSLKVLEKLWDATSQSQSTLTNGSFDLYMGRPEDAVFTFGSSSGVPFYTITTYDTQEIGITKTCPRKQTLTCDVALSKVEDACRRDDPSDGLISFIFPKMAAMMAMNQSSALADDYALSPTDLDEIQDAAVKRAASQEASRLCWNTAEKRYELDHPAVTRKHRQPDFVSSPLSPQGLSRPLLHITVAISEHHKDDRPVIIVTFPGTAQAKSPPTDGGVTSPSTAEPIPDVHLASLDLNTHTLHIEANSILEFMPSLFAIDSIFSAIATVAIADPHANRAIGKMKVSPPIPRTSTHMSRSDPSQTCVSPTTGAFYATIAEREGAEEEAKARAKTRKKSLRDKTKSTISMEPLTQEVDLEAGRSWYGRSKKKEKKTTKQIVIAEFDLEKLTHYQSGSRQGRKLPTITVSALTMTVNTLKFVVWIQTMFVKFLCWLMVGITRGVTSEKF